LAIRERALPRDHPDVGQPLNNLATLYEKQDRHADSEPLFKRSLAIHEKALGPEHPAVATLLNNLGQVDKAEGRTPDALPLVERTIASGHAQLHVALPVLSAAPRQQFDAGRTSIGRCAQCGSAR
jgi:tetratricopeptide (TPR) repeat protein